MRAIQKIRSGARTVAGRRIGDTKFVAMSDLWRLIEELASATYADIICGCIDDREQPEEEAAVLEAAVRLGGRDALAAWVRQSPVRECP